MPEWSRASAVAAILMTRYLVVSVLWQSLLAVRPVSAERQGQTVWQIGRFDNDFRELGKTRDYRHYLKYYARPVDFVIGESDAREDWPFIHPGPADRFAKRRAHAYTIRFRLDEPPDDRYLLRIDLVDTHHHSPPKLTIRINEAEGSFATPIGGDDASFRDPSKGKEHVIDIPLDGELLRRGQNRIVILNDRGSHVTYDALALLRNADPQPRPSRLIARPTPMYVETEQGLARLARVRIVGPAAQRSGTLHISVGGKEMSQAVRKGHLGDRDIEARFPVVEAAAEARLVYRFGSERIADTMAVKPAKKWRLYITPTVHTDIGYTHHQSEVALRQNKNTERAIALCTEHPDYRFKLECTWSALQWERHRGAKAMARLMDLVRKGRIGVEANYASMLTGLCSGEELLRMLYPAADLARRYGIPLESVTQNDTPSQVWSLPTVLHHAGIKALTIGVNNNECRAPMLRKGLDRQSPFWWEGPNGGRVLTWLTKGYVAAYYTGLIRGFAEAEEKLPVWLEPWQRRENYPYDAIMLHGAYSDNWAIDEKLAEAVAAWNAQYAYPRLILSSSGEFFDYILDHHADTIPTVRGCGGCYWEDGAASSARATAVNRNSHQRIVAAETLWAVLHATKRTDTYPRDRIMKAWEHILLFDEHTWGARRWGLDPEHHTVKEQWATKRGYAMTADRISRDLLSQGMERLIECVSGTGRGVVVFNPSSWTRTDVVRMSLPAGARLVDPTGKSVAMQQLSVENDEARIAFLAEDIPGIGYRRYDWHQADRREPGKRRSASFAKQLENRFYRVTLDDRSGGIASLIDKATGRELVDADSPYRLGEVIYASGGADTTAIDWNKPYPPAEFELSRPKGATWERMHAGAVLTSARSQTKTKRLPEIRVEVTLYEAVKRIDLTVRLRKELTYEMEAVYIAFPFAATKREFHLEIGGGWVRPDRDMLPGACLDWFCTQYGVLLNTGGGSVALAPIDTPLVQLCAINTGKWLTDLTITNGTVFAYAMNNYWPTNYRPGQSGEVAFRYAITSAGALSRTDATHHGWGAAQPLVIAGAKKVSDHASLPRQGSFLRMGPPNVVLTALKRAEDGRGLIVRALETAGQPSQFQLKPGLMPAASTAWRCDGVERKLEPLELDEGGLLRAIAPHGIETIRLEP